MAFIQRIRLPFFLTQPTWPLSQEVFRLANGKLRNTSSVVRKVYAAKTDWMPEAWHEGLRVALAHDYIQVEGRKFIGKVQLEGDAYTPQYNDFLDYPLAMAEFQLQVDEFDFSNSSCISCDQAGQLDLTDDNFGTVDEGDSGGGNVLANDQVFCSPAVVTLVNYNTSYLATPPTINNDGDFVFTLLTPLPDITSANIARYRVTCPDGSYDEADVYININGSLAGCSPPENLRDLTEPTDTYAEVTWDENGSPADGYYWELYEADNLGALILSNTPPLGFPRAQMNGLAPCTDYRLFVRAVCEAGVRESAFAEITFSTDCPPAGCGRYEIGYDSGTPTRDQAEVTYLACNDTYVTRRITNTQVILACLRESSPGNPADIYGGFTSVNYIEPC